MAQIDVQLARIGHRDHVFDEFLGHCGGGHFGVSALVRLPVGSQPRDLGDDLGGDKVADDATIVLFGTKRPRGTPVVPPRSVFRRLAGGRARAGSRGAWRPIKNSRNRRRRLHIRPAAPRHREPTELWDRIRSNASAEIRFHQAVEQQFEPQTAVAA